MYAIIIPNSVKKDLKKLDKLVIKKIIDCLETLSQNPTSGIPLSGNLSDLRRLKIHHQKTEYRIVYRVINDRIEIHILHVGTRENLYEELKRRL